MIRIGLFFLFFLLTVKSITAGTVTPEQARKAASVFYYERISQHEKTGYSPVKITRSFVRHEEEVPVYYIFTINDRGYVIVSAEDAVTPVLAYSFESIYSTTDQPPQFVAWMDQYARQIRFAQKSGAKADSRVSAEWNHLLNADSSSFRTFKNQKEVLPMIHSNWNQPFPYNELCPADPAGSNGHAIAGCVPVAMGQLMYYYRWPDHGTGSYTYFDSTYGIQHACFDSTWYDWENMKNTITTSDSGIAKLLYHLGVSVDLRYGPDGSGMYNHKAAYSLRTYFKYSPETQYLFRDSTSLKWDSVILAHLDRKMPLYYAGWSVPNINGHAFICDGYQGGDYFHFNFGWSGSFNGYFYLDNLIPGGNNFNLAQELIINCYPDTLQYSYPSYCTGSQSIRFNQGSLTDGSGPDKNYLAGSECNWLLDPQTETDSISKITLTFDQFETHPGDVVTVYDGADTASAVLGTYSGAAIPGSISSTGNKMRIRFTAGSGNTAPGFSADYATTAPVWCSGQKTITADTADITDGSLRFNYRNNSLCRWMLTPAGNKKPLTVYFKSFDTEPLKDVLKILDPETHDTLALISGHYSGSALPDSVSSPSGKMFIIFSSNSSSTADGWHLYYPRSSSGISGKSEPNKIRVFPNPAAISFNVEFNAAHASAVEMRLTTIQGQILDLKQQTCEPGLNLFLLDSSGLTAGMYLLYIENESGTETHKIIIAGR